MFERMRNLARRARRRLRPKKQKQRDTIPAAFAYRALNAMLLEMMAESRRQLRPSYTWGILHAAHLARTLGMERISAIELGVAGGNGLCALELAAEKVGRAFGVVIDVYGFDTGVGLPKPDDYRDMPNLYMSGDYEMDVERLRARLTRAELILGPVAETVPAFLDRRPAPIGFISFDLDYYSSTIDALALLSTDYDLLAPRVHCYFDDILGFTCSEFTGERLAITEFNEGHPSRKISPIFGLKYLLPPAYREESFADKYYLAHFFDHPRYNDPDGLVVGTATETLTKLHVERETFATTNQAPLPSLVGRSRRRRVVDEVIRGAVIATLAAAAACSEPQIQSGSSGSLGRPEQGRTALE